ncbi:hypothetical protein N657DRAFT_448037 [Parathielavia appendiculata]|uniref:N-acetyltransferase domain-containing protein n=1 Tax=Parathielavia appendiculata TaxID=2587402 RepID=A0AAN6Z2Q2_9PEZI|nr:hypothetical protein N657DRAFT_448037 [Parathielavia appendiculata]
MQGLETIANHLFPSLRRGPAQPGFWTQEEIGRMEVATWCAEGLWLMEEDIKSETGATYGAHVQGGGDWPVGYIRCLFEWGSEAEEAKANSETALKLFRRGELTPADMGAPSTMDMEYWLVLCDGMNKAREHIYRRMELDDFLICRVLQLFVRPKFWRLGVGSRLVEEACEYMDKHVAIGFAYASQAAVGLYAKFGFDQLSTVEGSFGELKCMIRVPPVGGLDASAPLIRRLQIYRKTVAALIPAHMREQMNKSPDVQDQIESTIVKLTIEKAGQDLSKVLELVNKRVKSKPGTTGNVDDRSLTRSGRTEIEVEEADAAPGTKLFKYRFVCDGEELVESLSANVESIDRRIETERGEAKQSEAGLAGSREAERNVEADKLKQKINEKRRGRRGKR